MKKRLKQTEGIKPQEKIIKVFKIVMIGLVLFFILEIWMVNRLSTYGSKIEILKQSQARLQLENQLLENAIAQKSSLQILEKESNQLGFDSFSQVEYFKPRHIASKIE